MTRWEQAAILVAGLWTGCAGPAGPDGRAAVGADTDTDSDTDTGSDTGTGTVGGPTTDPTDVDCAFDAAGVERVTDHLLLVFEDFELLADGRVVTGANNHLIAYVGWGDEMEMFGYGLGINPTGVRALADGTIAVADVAEGTVSAVDVGSGGVAVLAAGLSNPNGLTAARDGLVYVSEHVDGGRVVSVDPATAAVDTVATFASDEAPNGLALEPGDGSLVVAVRTGGGDGARIDRVDLATGARTTVGTFPGEELDAVGVDACGGVYVAPYSGGALRRIGPTGAVDELVDLSDLGAISGMRWGIGTAALPRDHLYVSAQHTGVTEIAVGVTGAPTVF